MLFLNTFDANDLKNRINKISISKIVRTTYRSIICLPYLLYFFAILWPIWGLVGFYFSEIDDKLNKGQRILLIFFTPHWHSPILFSWKTFINIFLHLPFLYKNVCPFAETISAILPCEIQSFNFDLWKNGLWSFFHYKQIF